MAGKTQGAQFLRYMGPVIEALKDLGGSGRPAEVQDWIASHVQVSESDQSELLASGQSRFYNQLHWARFYLAKAGYIDSSKRGVWVLTSKGLSSSLTRKDEVSIFKSVQTRLRKVPAEADGDDAAAEETPVDEEESYTSQLLSTLLSLPPEGFERLCQRLLRESGFQNVNVTGRSGDGGIDGNGLLQLNPFVSFRVLFQCKRYSGSVSVSQIRDFRGAMQGRADKGIILTTGGFTQDAKGEAVRDGVPPIELVDRDKLLDMLQELGLGLKPIVTYQVDDEFFDEFRAQS